MALSSNDNDAAIAFAGSERLRFAAGFWVFAAMACQWLFAACIFACRG